MWSITSAAKEKFRKCHLLPIHESDEDWERALQEAEEEGEDLIGRLKVELEEVKQELVQVVPSWFIPYVENGTLNQPTLPKDVREDYLQWMNESSKEFEQVLDAAFEHTQQALPFLSPAVQDVFMESLHDATIERMVRDEDTLHLYVNTDGGFSTKSLIHFSFEGVTSEETDTPIEIGQWLIYDELQKTDDGFAFRVLFECPDAEWTITAKHIDAEYFYRPKLYTRLRDEEKLEGTSLAEYAAMLNPEYRYWFITPDVECVITSLTENIAIENGSIELGQTEFVVTFGNNRYSYPLSQFNPIQFVYTDVYEDPYAHFNEPVPEDELEAAALGDNLELQARAWNTMYANSRELKDIINRVLGKIEITDENEMMISVMVSHFYTEGILTEAMVNKFRTVID
ncbi:DUF4085 family protein [Bacillus sp. FJAT-29814]|uniref:DUF4085 family protein n=1 Tax=Bacillus sp. FJAT-29814 TaxID=1729688 RepID=UPI000834E6DA|nr:DUF4085 family protein [Bacillus sp. FJAT-29814]